MKKSLFNKVVAISIIMMVALGIMLSPVFELDEVHIFGHNRLTEQWIKETAGVLPGINLLLFNDRDAAQKLRASPYAADVKIHKEYPNGLSIEIIERELSGYVKYLDNTYLYVDGEGVVLEVASFFTEPFPVIIGLDFNEFDMGERLEVKNPASFDVMTILAQLFHKYEMESQVIRMDIRDVSDIHLFIGNIDIQFGDIKNADEKVRTIITIIENFPDETITGTLDISDTGSPVSRFRVLK